MEDNVSSYTLEVASRTDVASSRKLVHPASIRPGQAKAAPSDVSFGAESKSIYFVEPRACFRESLSKQLQQHLPDITIHNLDSLARINACPPESAEKSWHSAGAMPTEPADASNAASYVIIGGNLLRNSRTREGNIDFDAQAICDMLGTHQGFKFVLLEDNLCDRTLELAACTMQRLDSICGLIPSSYSIPQLVACLTTIMSGVRFWPTDFTSPVQHHGNRNMPDAGAQFPYSKKYETGNYPDDSGMAQSGVLKPDAPALPNPAFPNPNGNFSEQNFTDYVADEEPAKKSVADYLTPRQLEVLEHLRTGKSNKYIAAELDLCESTIKVHVSEIMRRLGATSRTHASFIYESNNS